MQYNRLGDTGLIVSRIGFGAMTFGAGTGRLGGISKLGEEPARELVARALDAGVNHFNTANGYGDGESERLLGKVLGARRKDVVISTKGGFRAGEALIHQGLSRQHILAAAEDSLRRLGTDYIDVYLVHRTDPYTPVEETCDALDALVRCGKVRYVGFSNWPAWLAAKAVGTQERHGWARFRAAEMYYSLVGRELDHEIAPFVADSGIGVFVWSPLAGGFLSGKYSRENPQGDGGRLTTFDFLPVDKERGYGIVDAARKIATAHQATPAQIALAWVLAKPFVASVLVGASKLGQLDDNLGAANLTLSAAELAELDKISAIPPIYPNWFTAFTRDPLVKKAFEGKLPEKSPAKDGQ
jgi:aryl-alcohol dehydrogenase-like predicted oxidoreductase